MTPEYIDMTVAKKWREYRDVHGILFPDPHVRMIDACQALLPHGAWCLSPWSEEHAYDFVMRDKVVTWGCAASSKSNDYGLFTVMHWITDPYKTVCIVGSTTLKALQSRTWEAIVRYHSHLKNNTAGFMVPGVFSRTGYAVVNVADPTVADSQGAKASIQGRALNEGGTLQGAHLDYVLILVDEIATVANQSIVTDAMINLRSGATDFRAFFLANPEDWSNPSCQYCEPEDGIESVSPDTGVWESTMGFKVRHHDGLKSPRVLDTENGEQYKYLMGPEDIEENLKISGGNEDAATMWKMVRGFPRPASTTAETVLDYTTATARGACDPFEPTGHDTIIATCAGCDPAWSSGGDAALWQQIDIILSLGTVFLVFRPSERLPISASSGVAPIEQLSKNVYRRLLDDPSLDPRNVAYDASGNQSLGGVVAMFTGVSGLEINNSKRASNDIIRLHGRPASESIYDRGSESWSVLAEFVRAGQVRQLPKDACRQLCSRRWAVKGRNTSTLAFPLRMEPKEVWSARESRGGLSKSPDDCDGASLAVMAAKEVLGIIPWSGAVPDIIAGGALPGFQWDGGTPPQTDRNEGAYGSAPTLDTGGYSAQWG